MKRKLTIYGIVIVCIVVIFTIAICVSKNRNNINENFYLKYEYQDSWGGKINQVIEINNLEYTYSFLVENHHEVEDSNSVRVGCVTEEKSNELNDLFQDNNKVWKKDNKKIVEFLNCTTDMPSEHLVITRNGVTVELDYLPMSVESVLEDVVDEHIWHAIERSIR